MATQLPTLQYLNLDTRDHNLIKGNVDALILDTPDILTRLEAFQRLFRIQKDTLFQLSALQGLERLKLLFLPNLKFSRFPALELSTSDRG